MFIFWLGHSVPIKPSTVNITFLRLYVSILYLYTYKYYLLLTSIYNLNLYWATNPFERPYMSGPYAWAPKLPQFRAGLHLA